MNLPEPGAIDESLLIHKTRRIIAAIGIEKTLALLNARGGTYLELPQGYSWRKKRVLLAALIGEPAADAFHKEFAADGRKMLLPKIDKILIQVRDRKICAEAATTSLMEQALQYRLSVRQILNIRGRGPAPLPQSTTAQFDLFSASPPDSNTARPRDPV